jgi:EpsI family protein
MISRMIVLSVILVGGSFAARPSRPEPVPPRQAFSQFPLQIDRWQSVESSELDPRTLETLGLNDYVNRLYAAGNAYAGLYVGYYQSQRQGDTVHSPLNCLPGSGWQPLSRRYLDVRLADGKTISVNRYVIQKGLDRQVVLYWYQSHGRVVPNEYVGKFYLVYDAIRLNRTDAALVRVVSPIANASPDAEAAANDQAVDFVVSIFPVLARYLPSS